MNHLSIAETGDVYTMDEEGNQDEDTHGNMDGKKEERLVILDKDEEEVHHSALHSKDSGIGVEDNVVFHRELDARNLGDMYKSI